MTSAEVEKTLEQMTQRIVGHFQPNLILLFGSYATGRVTPDSDVDILVVLPVKGSVRHAACAIDEILSDRVLPLDLVVLTPEQFARQKETFGTVAWEAVREGKVLYERAA